MTAASPNGNAFGVERRKRVNPNKSSPAKTKPPRRDLTRARGMNDNDDGPISVPVRVPRRRERYEYPALGASGVARAGVLGPRGPRAVSTGGDSGQDVRIVSALVLALSRRRRDIGGGGSDAAGSHAHPAVARFLGRRRHHDRDDLRHHLSPDAR